MEDEGCEHLDVDKVSMAWDALLPARFGSYSGQFEVRGDTGLDHRDFTGEEHEGRSETRVRRRVGRGEWLLSGRRVCPPRRLSFVCSAHLRWMYQKATDRVSTPSHTHPTWQQAKGPPGTNKTILPTTYGGHILGSFSFNFFKYFY